MDPDFLLKFGGGALMCVTALGAAAFVTNMWVNIFDMLAYRKSMKRKAEEEEDGTITIPFLEDDDDDDEPGAFA